MAQPLMPKATAVWMIDNTTLTFEQVAAFCVLHLLEVNAIADGEVAVGIVGLDPVANGQLSREELERCIADPSARLVMSEQRKVPVAKTRRTRYTPLSKRQDKPDAIAWLLRNVPDVTDPQISKLLGTTKNTIRAVRDRTHWNAQNIRPRDPVMLGLCTQVDLNKVIAHLKSETGDAPPPVTAAPEQNRIVRPDPVPEAAAPATEPPEPTTAEGESTI